MRAALFHSRTGGSLARAATASAAALVTCLALAPAPATAVTPALAPASTPEGTPTTSASSSSTHGFLVGRGIADITGEVAEAGMMGYADLAQTSQGLHMRQRARAFVFADASTRQRVLHVTTDTGMIFQSVRDEVLERLGRLYGPRYGEANVMLTATHTHAGPGGYSHHNLYNLTTLGHHDQTFDATVDGIVAAVVRAEEDLSPSALSTSVATLANASAQRSRRAFDRNPAADKAVFPTGTDTTSTTLHVEREGEAVGLLNWFAVHATSMRTDNRLVSGDNKGFAAWHHEHRHGGVDHLDDERDQHSDFIAAYAQSNAGDMSPNLNLRPGSGPTEDEFENTRIIGTRMVNATRSAPTTQSLTADGYTSAVDSRIVYVDMADVAVDGEFTPDGRPGRTCSAAFGAAFAAGSTEDGGGGLPIFKEGKDGGNPVVKVIADALYTASPALKACQAPKEVLLPVGALDLVQQKLPVQLLRIGDLHVIGMPGEVTAVAGLRLRREVARVLDVDISKVITQGYSNAYGHYVTTPEEYAAGEYEGASTLFGRHELPAFQQTVHQLAEHMEAGTSPALGAKERDRSALQIRSLQGRVGFDVPQIGKKFGDVLTRPAASYRTGERAAVTFAGAHPNNNLQHGGSYLFVERLDRKASGDTWVRVADDGDFSTRMLWKRDGIAASKVTITWDVPTGARGTYRIRYAGHQRNLLGRVKSFSGTSPTFTVN